MRRIRVRQQPTAQCRFLSLQVENDVGLLTGRDPNVLAPFGHASLVRRADAVLPFRKRREPEAALLVGFRGLDVMAFRGLQCDSRTGDGFAVRPQDLARDCAETFGLGRSSAANGYRHQRQTRDQ